MAYEKNEAYIDKGYGYGYDPEVYYIMLPHSCDEWVIGNIQDAQNLIDDLQKLIKELEAKGDK